MSYETLTYMLEQCDTFEEMTNLLHTYVLQSNVDKSLFNQVMEDIASDESCFKKDWK